MTKREIAKKTVANVAMYGTGTVVYSIIQNNVVTTRIDHKIGVGVASFALAGVVADAARKYTDNMIDELCDAFNKAKND